MLQGEYVAVKCLLIGKITEINDINATIDWCVGTYSGIWKEWRGRKDGKAVVFSDTIIYN